SGGLVLRQDGVPLALVNDGARNTQLWKRESGAWQLDQQLSGVEGGYSHGFAQGQDGVLHAALYGGTEYVAPTYGHFSQSWSYDSLSGSSANGAGLDWSIALALSSGGLPSVAFWETGSTGWRLYWSTPGATPEPVVDVGNNNSLEWFPLAV